MERFSTRRFTAWLCSFLFVVSVNGFANEALIQLEKSAEALSPAEGIELLDQFDLDNSEFDAESQAKFYFLYGQLYEKTRQLDLSIASYGKGIAFVKDLPVTDVLVDSYLERSFAHYLQTNDPSVYCIDRKQALIYARQNDNSQLLTKALTQNAFCYTEPATVQIGIDLLEEAMTIVDKSDKINTHRKAMIYNATGNLYRQVGLHQRGYENFEKAYLAWQIIDDKEDMFNMQHNMLSEALKLGDWSKAQQSIQVQFALAKMTKGYKDLLFFANLNAGRVALRMNEFSEAITHLEKAVSLHYTTKERYFKTSNYLFLALAYLRNGDADKATEMARKFTQDESFSKNQQSMILKGKAIVALGDNRPVDAMNMLLKVIDSEREVNQNIINKKVINSALEHNAKLAVFENQLLANKLAINELNWEAAEDKEHINELKLSLFLVLVLVLFAMVMVLLYSQRSLRARAQTDFLTGLYNRGYTFTRGQYLVEKANRKQQSVAVIIFDIDNFKLINDTHGHHIGDLALQALSKRAQALLKKQDLIGRIGGEEFLIVLPNVNLKQALVISERLRAGIAEQSFSFDDINLEFTISLGVADNLSEGKSLNDLAKYADEALYRAKFAGKNKVYIAAECA
ncbi:tetratricopeptide repeat-containing diguanylate cyclase [Shewanella donghaensis]|uniref:tetratricopeptide repeat-containing diguanylate cyclase n=1 Tax=Shewanella donghaensis TaxID=238836 RepID=UPI0011842F81|nr:GGDEF domain-containing protein [Shewanella donghaensis]